MKSSLIRFYDRFGHFLDPFLVLALVALLFIPAVTVLNLTPRRSAVSTERTVLGLADQSSVSVTPATENENGITLEKITQRSDTAYTLYVTHNPHIAGVYKSEVFTLFNGTDEEKRVPVTATFEGYASGTTIAIVINKGKFIVLGPDGSTYPPTIYIQPQKTTVVSIEVDSPTDVNYTTGFSLDLTVE